MSHNTERHEKSGTSLLGSLITGAAIGAAAVILSDKKKRDSIISSFNKFWGSAEEKLNGVKDKLQEEGKKAQKKLSKALESRKNGDE